MSNQMIRAYPNWLFSGDSLVDKWEFEVFFFFKIRRKIVFFLGFTNDITSYFVVLLTVHLLV